MIAELFEISVACLLSDESIKVKAPDGDGSDIFIHNCHTEYELLLSERLYDFGITLYYQTIAPQLSKSYNVIGPRPVRVDYFWRVRTADHTPDGTLLLPLSYETFDFDDEGGAADFWYHKNSVMGIPPKHRKHGSSCITNAYREQMHKPFLESFLTI
tara:strand:+ start:110 stop:580 length:471 start_codon:yes stop_codon:yes gene_type:complete